MRLPQAAQLVPQWAPQWLQSSNPKRTRAAKIALGLLAAALLVIVTLWRVWPTNAWIGTFKPDPALDITGREGAVASDAGVCSEMGVDVLKRGGSAADAAVVVALCIGSVNAQSSGIGGGGFITVRLPNGTAFVIDAREVAPLAAHKEMFDENPMLSRFGGLATAVPGELAGLSKLWEVAGRRPWKELVDSVAEINEVGFEREASFELAIDFHRGALQKKQPKEWEELKRASDWDWAFGEARSIMKRPQLGKTLRAVADGGAEAFYDPQGWIAQSLARITQRTGGVLTAEDIGNYSVVVKPALNTTFRGRTVFTAPAPASGNAFVMGLNVLDRILPDEPVDGDDDPVHAQRLVETMKWMAAARSELGDPAFVSNSKISEMLSAEWAQRVVGNISDAYTLASWRDYHPSYEMNEPSGTSHFSVLDKDGMAVSMTTTVNLLFGNSVCDPETGIVLNSEMDDFSVPRTRNSFDLAPSIYNFISPGKRPLSSTVPSVVVGDNGVEFVVGAAGGSRILTTVFQAMVRRYGFDLGALETSSYPRIHHQLIPERAELELGWPKTIYSELEERGHEVQYKLPQSTMSLISKDAKGVLHAISDFYRKRARGAAY